MVGRDLQTGRTRTWTKDVGGPAPYLSGTRDLVVAYAANAEVSCMLKLGWPMPHHMLDLHVVFSRLVNSHGAKCSTSLLNALDTCGIPHMSVSEKEQFRDLATGGEPLTPNQMRELVCYCQRDVIGTVGLFEALRRHINWPHDLLASRYTGNAVATIEAAGVPIDVKLCQRIRDGLPEIKNALKREVNLDTQVYGPNGEFSLSLFSELLRKHRIPWPRTAEGIPETKEETFKIGAIRHPQIAKPLTIQVQLNKMRNLKLPIGRDGRNRTSVRPFASKTGRNQPSSTRSIFGLGAWTRHLIHPPAGFELVCLDFEQQEFQIAAALSGDLRMLHAYKSGDPYLALARLSGALDSVYNPDERKAVRDLFKTGTLGIQYGITADGLAPRVGGLLAADKLIRHHQQAFPVYWGWTRRIQQLVSLHKIKLVSPYGWPVECNSVAGLNVRSVANFPIQAAGADIMRIASISLVERDIPLVWTMHDGFLLVCPEGRVEKMVADSVRLLEESSAVVTGGHTCRVGVRRFGVNQPFHDEKGRPMFDKIMGYLSQIEGRAE